MNVTTLPQEATSPPDIDLVLNTSSEAKNRSIFGATFGDLFDTTSLYSNHNLKFQILSPPSKTQLLDWVAPFDGIFSTLITIDIILRVLQSLRILRKHWAGTVIDLPIIDCTRRSRSWSHGGSILSRLFIWMTSMKALVLCGILCMVWLCLMLSGTMHFCESAQTPSRWCNFLQI